MRLLRCLLCALKTNAYSADLDPDTLSVEAGYGRIVLPGTQVHLNATLTNGPGARVMWRQVRGTAAAISSTNTLQTTVSVPADVSSAETLLFEVRAEMESGQQASDIVWVEVYVPQHNPADLTLVADFSPKVGWECNQDPVEVPEVQTRVLENTIEYTSNGIPGPCDGAVSQPGKSEHDLAGDANLAHSPQSRKDGYAYRNGCIWHHARGDQTRTRYGGELSQPTAVELRGTDPGYSASIEGNMPV